MCQGFDACAAVPEIPPPDSYRPEGQDNIAARNVEREIPSQIDHKFERSIELQGGLFRAATVKERYREFEKAAVLHQFSPAS